jgi:hypothetical protein
MEMKMLELWEELNKLPSAAVNRLMSFQAPQASVKWTSWQLARRNSLKYKGVGVVLFPYFLVLIENVNVRSQWAQDLTRSGIIQTL